MHFELKKRLMKKIILSLYVFLLLSLTSHCQAPGQSSVQSSYSGKKLLRVPAQYNLIAEAVQNANPGDTIIIAPGNYTEKNIKLNDPIIISSEWKLTGDTGMINKTCINADSGTLFKIHAEGVEISGLKMMNGDHLLEIYAKSKIVYNHVVNDRTDGISFESGAGGYIAYNLIENAGDDGIDIDIGENPKNIGSDVVVEYNTIANSHDDGIEIRLYNSPNQNIHYEIRNNIFLRSRNDGIQLISYNTNTGKVFSIHHNIFKGCNVALGCMEGAKTVEDLGGSPLMDERVYFYNNTIIENNLGATGGNNIIAINNVVYNNRGGGFKRFGKSSVIVNNLFFENNNSDFVDLDPFVTVRENIFQKDPLLNKSTFAPAIKSPCIDRGMKRFALNDQIFLKLSADAFIGSAPDIGALELNQQPSK